MENNKSVSWWQKFDKHKFRKLISSGEVHRYVQVFPAKPVCPGSHHEQWDKERLSVRNSCEKFLSSDPKLNPKFLRCSKTDKDWILDYLSLEKEVIRYEIIQRFDSLDIVSGKDVFICVTTFIWALKDSVISNEDYAAVKKLYQMLDLDNLGQLNKLHSFQDTVILAEIFGRRSNHLQKLQKKFNPRKCNSASSFSGCFHHSHKK